MDVFSPQTKGGKKNETNRTDRGWQDGGEEYVCLKVGGGRGQVIR